VAATIGIDIGGTKVLGLLVDEEGAIKREALLASPDAGLDALVTTAHAIVTELAAPGAPVGVGAAGLVNEHGVVRYAPNLPMIREAPLRDALADVVGHPVIVDNDANVAAIGECSYGAARGRRHVLLVTLGTGIGGGLVLDGELYRGARGFAGEVGHFTVDIDGPRCACGELGHWEAIASGTALGRMARELVVRSGAPGIVTAAGGEKSAVTGVHVGTAAAQGDEDAQHLLVQYADNVALGLAALANILDPECIVISGGVVRLGVLLFSPLRDAFRRHVEAVEYRPPIDIVPAELGERAGAIGAAVLARSLA
jgi:glucokinase